MILDGVLGSSGIINYSVQAGALAAPSSVTSVRALDDFNCISFVVIANRPRAST